MSDVIHIIGHKNPDTDSIVAAIAYAELKRSLGQNAIACRLGDLNPETDFVLKKFDVNEPVYIQNARVRLYDVEFDEPLTIRKDSTIKLAWEKIMANRTGALYVVDENQRLIGVVSMSDISSILLDDHGSGNKTLMKNTPSENIVRVLEGRYVYQAPRYNPNGEVHIIGGKSDIYTDLSYKNSIVIMKDNLALQRRVILDGAACLILVEADVIAPSLIDLAKQKGTTIIQSDLSLLCTVRRVFKASSIELLMKRKVITFNNHEYIDDVYKQMSKTRFRSYPVVNNQGVVLGSISRYHLLNYKKKKFILVDHNELSQSIDYLNEAEVLEIVDHHRIGDVETTTPIQFRNEIIGSTCTIIYKMYKEHGLVPSKQIASILCCAMISDTMNFNSPTTTAIDRELGKELAQIADVNLDDLANEMFSAVATIKGRSMSEILYNDFKEYNIDGKRIAIGQINITDEQEIIDVKEEFTSYMKNIHDINNFDLLMMCFTQADGSGSNLLFVGNLSYVVDEAFKDDIMNDRYFVDGVISRKKQIIPALSKQLSSM